MAGASETTSDFLQYKAEKEAWVSGLKGTTLEEVIWTLSIGPAVSFFSRIFLLYVSRILLRRNIPSDVVFLLEMVTIVLPTLVAFTLAHYTRTLISGLVLCSLFMIGYAWVVRGQRLVNFLGPEQLQQLSRKRIPFVSDYRAGMMLGTCIAILAVDFAIFPRRFAKTETFGYSVMDIGVGSFLFSNALMFRPPKNSQEQQTRQWRRVLTSLAPILIMGFIRLAGTKGTGYQEHASEYGTHWNFYFTLAAVTILTTVFNIQSSYMALFGILVGIVYEVLLVKFGLTDYIMEHPRSNLIHANKEGIMSSLGYYSMFLIGAQLGNILRKERTRGEWINLLVSSIAVDALLWGVLLYMVDNVEPVSRRMANLPYILFVLAMNLWLMIGFSITDLFAAPLVAGNDGVGVMTAVNRNQLATFIIANLFVGIVNFSMKTLYAPDSTAFLVLTLYMVAVCTLPHLWSKYNLTLKFW